MQPMKILIACDGSAYSDQAIDELAHAGLPETGTALMMTVAEVWLPPPEQNDGSDKYLEDLLRRHREKGERLVREAQAIADNSGKRVRYVLPRWTIEQKATYGSPAWAVISAADEFLPDLIVVGSHGESAIERLVLGSISQKILTEANCSVRVSRERRQIVETHGLRLVIGYDGLAGAEAAVDAVAGRNWPPNTHAKLVIALDPVDRSLVERLVAPFSRGPESETELEHKWISALANKASQKLTAAGLTASIELIAGKPNELILREAQEWNADCIFLGANSYGGRFERFLLGSTSAAVAARAHCSVEVVRQQKL